MRMGNQKNQEIVPKKPDTYLLIGQNTTKVPLNAYFLSDLENSMINRELRASYIWIFYQNLHVPLENPDNCALWVFEYMSVMAEWLGCQTLNQRVLGSNLSEGTAWYLWAGYLKSTAQVDIISRIACGTPNLSLNTGL
jgi:hypothetical protein